jgi:hypothetical protein
VNVLELARFNPDPDRLRHLLDAWRGRHRNLYFVKTYRTDLCGLFLKREGDYTFGTREWERTLDRAPVKAEPRGLTFTVSRVVPPEELQVPALDELDIGGSDDFQVSGFFDKEGGADRTYRWTGACASVYLPGLRPGSTLVVTATADKRPADRPVQVRVSVNGVAAGAFTPGTTWGDHRIAVPESLPPGPPVLRLDVVDAVTGRSAPWRPENTLPGSHDGRDLGIMLDRIRIDGGVTPGPAGPRANLKVSAKGGGA